MPGTPRGCGRSPRQHTTLLTVANHAPLQGRTPPETHPRRTPHRRSLRSNPETASRLLPHAAEIRLIFRDPTSHLVRRKHARLRQHRSFGAKPRSQKEHQFLLLGRRERNGCGLDVSERHHVHKLTPIEGHLQRPRALDRDSVPGARFRRNRDSVDAAAETMRRRNERHAKRVPATAWPDSRDGRDVERRARPKSLATSLEPGSAGTGTALTRRRWRCGAETNATPSVFRPRRGRTPEAMATSGAGGRPGRARRLARVDARDSRDTSLEPVMDWAKVPIQSRFGGHSSLPRSWASTV